MTTYQALSDFDSEPTERELASETKTPKPSPRSDQQADVGTLWQAWISEQIKRGDQQTMRAVLSAVAKVLAEQNARLAALEAELASLKQGGKRLKVVEDQAIA